MQKISVIKIIILICKLNIKNILTIYINIIKIKKSKEIIIFKIVFEKNKKILKFNNF